MLKTVIAIGSVLAVIGIICFLALLGESQIETIRPIGSVCFSLGTLIIATGVYLQARRLQAQYEPPVSKNKKVERLCSSCNRMPAVLFCRVHVLRLCSSCFEKHDDGIHCSFVPSKRAALAHK
jgi:hypothetical protein